MAEDEDTGDTTFSSKFAVHSSAASALSAHAGGASHSHTEQSRNMQVGESCHSSHVEQRFILKCEKNEVRTMRCNSGRTTAFASRRSPTVQQQSETPSPSLGQAQLSPWWCC